MKFEKIFEYLKDLFEGLSGLAKILGASWFFATITVICITIIIIKLGPDILVFLREWKRDDQKHILAMHRIHNNVQSTLEKKARHGISKNVKKKAAGR